MPCFPRNRFDEPLACAASRQAVSAMVNLLDAAVVNLYGLRRLETAEATQWS
jgi:hypothetical protein